MGEAKGKRAWVTVLTTNFYCYGVLALWQSIKDVGSVYPLLVIATNNVCKENTDFMTELGIFVERKPMLMMPDSILCYNLRADVPCDLIGWNGGWSKYYALGLDGYEKIVHLDADTLMYRNCDELFDRPDLSAVPDAIYADTPQDVLRDYALSPKDRWHAYPNAGVVAVTPSPERLDGFLKAMESLKPEYPISDQNGLAFLCRDWPERPDLHLPFQYNAYAKHLDQYPVWEIPSMESVRIIHYVGPKPWQYGVPPKGKRGPLARYAYHHWKAEYDACMRESASRLGKEFSLTVSDAQAIYYMPRPRKEVPWGWDKEKPSK